MHYHSHLYQNISTQDNSCWFFRFLCCHVHLKEAQTEIVSIRLCVPVVNSLTNYFNSEISVSNEKISDLHLKKSVNESKILDPIDNYKVIHQSIINYELDKQSHIIDPRGMYGDNLKLFSITSGISIKRSFISSVVLKKRFGLDFILLS